MRFILCMAPIAILVLFVLLLFIPLSNVQADETVTFDSETGVLFLPEVIVDRDIIFENTMLQIDLEYGTARLIQIREAVKLPDVVDCGPQFGPPVERKECE